MKISPISAGPATVDMQGNPAQSHVDMARLRMKVNATPETAAPPGMMPEDSTAPTHETEAAVEATKPLSPQLALLARQRRALQVKERELQAREKEFQSRATDNPSIELSRLKAEPLRVLRENGVTYDQLTEAILADQNPMNADVNALKAELKKLQEGIDQKFIEKDTQAEQQVYAEMQREAQRLAERDDFELVRETKNIPTVMRLIQRTYKETGEVLDVAEAMRLVEDELLGDMRKFSALKKIQGQLNPMAPPQQRQTGMRTLTNRDTASVPLSAKQRALAAFYGNLKR